MDEVGFFIVGKAKDKEDELVIFNKMRDMLTKEDFTKIAFCENEESHDILYTFLNHSKNKELFNLFESHGVLIHFSDITKEVLYQTNMNKILTEGEFKPLFDEFLKNNLTIDFILDKISTLGVESLTKTDYKILTTHGKY